METTFDGLENAVPAIRAGACECCGAPLEPSDRFCGACGGEQPGAAEPPVETERKRFTCKNCGADVSLEADQRSYVCAFCGSTYVVEFSPDETGRQEPEFVIGFAVTLDEARERFRKWLADTGWFPPRGSEAGESGGAASRRVSAVLVVFDVGEERLVGANRGVLVQDGDVHDA